MNKHFKQQGGYFRFVTKAAQLNTVRREVEALGFRFYGRTFVAPFGEDIWIDSNDDLAFATMRSDTDFDETFYGFSASPLYADRSKWVVNEPTIAVSHKTPIKVGDIVQVKRVDPLAAHEGVKNKPALAVVELIDGDIMTVVWRGRYANKDFANHAVVSVEDATLILSV